MKEVETEWHAAWEVPQNAQEQVTDEQENQGQEPPHSAVVPGEFSASTDVAVDVAEGYTTRRAKIKELDPHEDAEIRLFEAPFDELIANVAFIPSEQLQGHYYTRQLTLSVYGKNSKRYVVALVQLGSNEILLPGGERHNAHLLMPPTSLRVREGDSLVWSSIGSAGDGLAVPASSVEVALSGRTLPRRWFRLNCGGSAYRTTGSAKMCGSSTTTVLSSALTHLGESSAHTLGKMSAHSGARMLRCCGSRSTLKNTVGCRETPVTHMSA